MVCRGLNPGQYARQAPYPLYYLLLQPMFSNYFTWGFPSNILGMWGLGSLLVLAPSCSLESSVLEPCAVILLRPREVVAGLKVETKGWVDSVSGIETGALWRSGAP